LSIANESCFAPRHEVAVFVTSKKKQQIRARVSIANEFWIAPRHEEAVFEAFLTENP
jgi:hypothetical protein